MLHRETLYHLDDICIVPKRMTCINSRQECTPYFKSNGMLPIFASPMDSVVDVNNLDVWRANNIEPILPRTYPYEERVKYVKEGYWVAMGLKEFVEFYMNTVKPSDGLTYHICVDNANGHMVTLRYEVSQAKEMFGDKLIIMVGNIANPSTIEGFDGVADYIRCGIGGGQCCATSPQTAIHYPMASLISEMTESYPKKEKRKIKVVADGGIKYIGDAIKALALGADYVMIGTSFASLFESASDIYNTDHEIENELSTFKLSYKEFEKVNFMKEYKLKKYIYGMSTPMAQKKIDNSIKTTKTSEGVARFIDCTMTISQWVDKFVDAIRSTMSYCDCITIEEFCNGHVDCYVMSPNNRLNRPIDTLDDSFIVQK